MVRKINLTLYRRCITVLVYLDEIYITTSPIRTRKTYNYIAIATCWTDGIGSATLKDSLPHFIAILVYSEKVDMLRKDSLICLYKTCNYITTAMCWTNGIGILITTSTISSLPYFVAILV
ncbi:MAG: hypothetical protein ABIM31_05525 [candidate division WOR-3 bacterium]